MKEGLSELTKQEITMHNIQVIRDAVSEYYSKYSHLYIHNVEFFTSDQKRHVIDIGTSIIGTRMEIGFPGGSFVQSIVNNDLRGAVASADDVNANCIRFYVMMIYNIIIPRLNFFHKINN